MPAQGEDEKESGAAGPVEPNFQAKSRSAWKLKAFQHRVFLVLPHAFCISGVQIMDA